MGKVVCIETVHLAATKKRGMVTVLKGRTYDSKDSVVKSAPYAFIPADQWADDSAVDVVHHAVEAATAAPGESRSVSKPAKAKADADA